MDNSLVHTFINEVSGEEEGVLILVVMDNSLVLNTIPYKIELIKVLILVVMDNSLVL